ncbi:carbonic anhydrase [Pinisolibacter aquiterrae]|uniref:carbonic anhydrase n=1 Tax=Pinisolibacter aquiterrae TaxID=2815579 RepID=UPI001C3C81C7|nr:carbonic anhydrase [Pinisolibacter aquiterrae]MBV5264690.1 carbonic anhydrase [Pinisolibacter aquiterrae]MCC8233459.1 carbonic anhydrase [Pinisolibacter aquiterrae]
MFPDRLLAGYRAFRAGRWQSENARYLHLAEAGQKPEVMIIACCDSRAGPETIFDASPGELFVARNVANLVPPYAPDDDYHGTSAALEFAVMGLRVKHIVVMGHGRCGGIAAALKEAPEPLSPGDFIGKWISLLEKPVAQCLECGETAPAERHRLLERLSIVNSIENLRTFPCISALEASGRIALHGAWFDIALGELHVLDQSTGMWERLESRDVA